MEDVGYSLKYLFVCLSVRRFVVFDKQTVSDMTGWFCLVRKKVDS